MRDDFCAFILTHGRPDKVLTYKTLLNAGYTGKIYIVIDNEDKTEARYRENFGDMVLQFDKAASAQTFDEGDNFNDRRAIIYARNSCWDLARKVGCKYFIQLDDDYTNFALRFNSKNEGIYVATKKLDCILEVLIDYYKSINCLSFAMSQGGDLIGGTKGVAPKLKRKAMNSFICDVDRQFQFIGKINEDVNTYTNKSRSGALFFTTMHAQLVQVNTQKNKGGMTDIYLDKGTYIKTFYSVMYCPSSVRVSTISDSGRWGNPQPRIHHKINWTATAPKIIRESHRKRRASSTVEQNAYA